MVRIVRAWGLLALSLSLLAVASRADDKSKAFDGASGGSLEVPAVDKAALHAAATPSAAPAQRPHSDLYYFTKEEAAAAKKKFPFRKEGIKTELNFDADVPADIQAQMRADMAFIGTIKGGKGSALHRKIFGSVDGATYVNFFETRVTGIGMNDCGDAKAVACVIPFEDPSKMWLTQNFVKFSHPQIARMMVVFHESRHTESRNGNWSHATCPTPFLDANGNEVKSIWTGSTLAGEPACDVTPLGSYGSSTIMLKNVQKFCTNCTQKVKDDAGIYADDQLGRITDPDAKRQMVEDFAAGADVTAAAKRDDAAN
jgi:hypothetical protein